MYAALCIVLGRERGVNMAVSFHSTVPLKLGA